MKKATLCKGCWNITDDCFWRCGCGKRDFRVCCGEKHINQYGACGEFPCDDYRAWDGWHESHEKVLEHLRLLRAKN